MPKPIVQAILAAALFSTTVFTQAPEADRPIDVPDINGMAVSPVKPAFPPTAVDVGADGTTVTVRVVVDENGIAVSATCSTTCHPMLKDPAELAALQTKFKPLVREGRAVRYQGTMIYTYVVNRVDWFRFATALESVRQFDNISAGPVAQMLSPDFAAEKAGLLSLDAKGGAEFETRQRVLSDVTASVRSKLKGDDKWRFDLGLALRRITFWPQAAERIDRDALQKALEALSSNIAAAPADVPESMLKDLTALSRFRVPAEISEQDLRKTIMEMSRSATFHFAGVPLRPGTPR